MVRHSTTSDILNSPPSIISQSSGKVTGESIYEYKVVAEDADGDSLTYRLASAPEGMTINPSSGVIKWNVGEKQKGENHEFKVIVEDAEGALSIQPITLKVTFK
ncbi:MAG: putative Ig domain-containing protein [Deltaproteobacteria bacterium]|nr:putative Ig domain-containing protein [Deltaproteobacteria bacterium]